MWMKGIKKENPLKMNNKKNLPINKTRKKTLLSVTYLRRKTIKKILTAFKIQEIYRKNYLILI